MSRRFLIAAGCGLLLSVTATACGNRSRGVQAVAPVARQQSAEQQSDRDAYVRRITVLPNPVTVAKNADVVFTAIAEDGQGVPVGGVQVTWQARRADDERKVEISPTGRFKAGSVGRFRIQASAAGHKGEAEVVVEEPARRARTDIRQGEWSEADVETIGMIRNRRGRSPTAAAIQTLGVLRRALEDSGVAPPEILYFNSRPATGVSASMFLFFSSRDEVSILTSG
jgi:hypothetical protein